MLLLLLSQMLLGFFWWCLQRRAPHYAVKSMLRLIQSFLLRLSRLPWCVGTLMAACTCRRRSPAGRRTPAPTASLDLGHALGLQRLPPPPRRKRKPTSERVRPACVVGSTNARQHVPPAALLVVWNYAAAL